jgi:hypothetical protein
MKLVVKHSTIRRIEWSVGLVVLLLLCALFSAPWPIYPIAIGYWLVATLALKLQERKITESPIGQTYALTRLGYTFSEIGNGQYGRQMNFWVDTTSFGEQ